MPVRVTCYYHYHCCCARKPLTYFRTWYECFSQIAKQESWTVHADVHSQAILMSALVYTCRALHQDARCYRGQSRDSCWYGASRSCRLYSEDALFFVRATKPGDSMFRRKHRARKESPGRFSIEQKIETKKAAGTRQMSRVGNEARGFASRTVVSLCSAYVVVMCDKGGE